MAISEARHRANEKYNAKAYDEIKVRVPKGTKAKIKMEAEKNGESVNAFILRGIKTISGGSFGYDIGADNKK